MKKRGRGRPKKRPEEVLDQVVRIRLRQDEKRLIERAAERVGLRPSEWCRKVLLSNARQVK